MSIKTYKRVPFDNAGYFVIGIFIVALFGFVPSYLPSSEIEFTFYTHLHAVNMVLWLCVLIAQPFLIRRRLNRWHRTLGKVSYVQVPLLMLSSLLLIHYRIAASDPPTPDQFWIPFKDLIMIGTTYGLAIYYRRNAAYHARFMVGSCFQLLEPGLGRVVRNFLPFPSLLIPTYLVNDAILIYLIVKDRKLPRGKWIFRLVLGMTLSVQLVALYLTGNPELPWFSSFLDWFSKLPLT